MDLNTCYETTHAYHTIVYYSHLVPVALGLFLSIYALIRTKFSKLAIVFFAFTAGFSLWLVTDLIIWTSQDYHAVYFFWSAIDFINVAFFVFGAYFFTLLARTKVPLWEKGTYLLLCIPAFVMTIMGNSVTEFNQPVCEAFSSENLTLYKLFAEGVIVLIMTISLALAWHKADAKKRVQISVIYAAILLFFVIFAGTEYISSITYIYEINLYSLFVLPLFLIVLTFAITDLRLFDMRFVGTQILAYVLIIMVGSQLLYVEDATNRTLSLITLAVSLFLGILLIENAKREEEARTKIEDLAATLKQTNTKLDFANEHLKELDQMKSEFLSVASHQLRAPITAIRGYAANLVEGEYGKVPPALVEPLGVIQESARLMVSAIEDYLDISRIEQGRMKYEKSDFDIADLAKKVVEELAPIAANKKLDLSYNGLADLMINADIGKIRQVITNLVDNAIKYTETGSIMVFAEKRDSVARITIMDTGAGISAEEIGGLFEKFKRARGANKVNTTGTGLGLYVAKQLTEGNGGKIWVESAGLGKGSRFIFELPA